MAVFKAYLLAVVLLVVFGFYVMVSLLYRIFYNVFLHPLAHIPGPKIAGATYLYQTYFSLIGCSRYYIQIKRLHEIYGKAPKSSNLNIF